MTDSMAVLIGLGLICLTTVVAMLIWWRGHLREQKAYIQGGYHEEVVVSEYMTIWAKGKTEGPK